MFLTDGPFFFARNLVLFKCYARSRIGSMFEHTMQRGWGCMEVKYSDGHR